MLELMAIFSLVISSLGFYLHARKVNQKTLTLDSFMVADGTLNKREFANTWVASSFSLAMNVMFLLSSSNNYGLWILVSPITYVGGFVFFNWVVKKSNFDLKNSRTLADFFYLIYPSRAIARLVTALTLGSYIMLLFVELYMGTVVLTVFLGDGVIYKTLAFFSIGMLVLMLVRLGGYLCIIYTDRQQLLLIILAVSSIFLYGFMCPVANNSSAFDILIDITQYKENPLVFMIWLSVINFVYPFSQLANYQRVTATKCANTSFLGVVSGSRKLLMLFLLTIGGFLLLGAKGYQANTITEFLMLVKNSDGAISYLFVPLILGFGSMIYSSADVAVIATFYSLSDMNTFRDRFSKLNENELRKVLTVSTIILLLVLTLIYFLQIGGLEAWLMPLIYTIVGQLAILVPVPLYILVQEIRGKELSEMQVNRKNTLILFNGIIFSWVMLFVSAYISKVTGNPYWSLLSMPVGIVIVFCSILLLNLKKNRKLIVFTDR